MFNRCFLPPSRLGGQAEASEQNLALVVARSPDRVRQAGEGEQERVAGRHAPVVRVEHVPGPSALDIGALARLGLGLGRPDAVADARPGRGARAGGRVLDAPGHAAAAAGDHGRWAGGHDQEAEAVEGSAPPAELQPSSVARHE